MDVAATAEPDIFNAARRIPDSAERQAYLMGACAGDDSLLERIQGLLHVHDSEPGFLEPAPVMPPGDTIGPYRLKERLGEGGMGVVYRAEQTAPVRRDVAIKIVRPGLDSGRVLGRFEAERQALALMDHPNIARVLDAGESPGPPPQPYFVMEWIQGVPITRYCDEHRLPPAARLKLFLEVCRAVQHAHQKGVIHRDLKPSNVLVTEVDGDAVAKVIDFGIAKAIGTALTDQPHDTVPGTVLGTLEYMSPEQAEPGRADVDTRSDVYSLGVLLYKLLTGTTPLPALQLKDGGYLEALRIIREDEPPKPSTRLPQSNDLDCIVMKCLEKNRARRYDTAAALARDVERYLNAEPIEARPPSPGYRLRMFAVRHKAALAFSLGLAAALVGGTAVSISQAVRASRAERAALKDRDAALAAAAAEHDAREAALKRLGQLERGHEILGAIFRDLDPVSEAKDGLPLRTLLAEKLDAAVAALDDDAVGDPVTVARLQSLLARSLLGLGSTEPAIALFEKVHKTYLTHLGPDDARTLNAAASLAEGHQKAGRLDRALPLFEQTLAAAEDKLGAEHVETIDSKNGLAIACLQAKQAERAVQLFQQVLESRRKLNGEDHEKTWTTKTSLALAYQNLNRHAEALALIETVVNRNYKRWGPNHVRTLGSMTNFAGACQMSGQSGKALEILEEVLRRQIATLGGDHPDAIQTLNNIAGCHFRAQRFPEALPYLLQAAAALERRRFVHPFAGRILDNLAICLAQLRQFEQAETWKRKWIAALRERGDTDSVVFATNLSWLGHYLARQSKWSEAEAAYRECVPIFRQKAPDDWNTFSAVSNWGDTLCNLKKYAEAEPLLKEGYEGLKTRQAAIPPNMRQSFDVSLQRIVKLYEAWDKPDEAAKWRQVLPAKK